MNKTFITLCTLILATSYITGAAVDQPTHSFRPSILASIEDKSPEEKSIALESFALDPLTAINDIANLIRVVPSSTAADILEVYVTRADATKPIVLVAAKLMKALGNNFKARAKSLEALAAAL